MAKQDSELLIIRLAGESGNVDLRSFIRVVKESLAILREIDARLSLSGRASVSWEIQDISKNSPIALTLAPTRKSKPITAKRIIKSYMSGFSQISRGREPKDFSLVALRRTRRMVRTFAQDGLANLTFEAPSGETVAPKLDYLEKITRIIEAKRKYRYEDTTFEGKLLEVNLRGSNRFYIDDVFTGQSIRCYFAESMDMLVANGMRKRVLVTGTAKYKESGAPVSMRVSDLRIIKKESELTRFEDMKPINITDGMESSAYVRGMRDD